MPRPAAQRGAMLESNARADWLVRGPVVRLVHSVAQLRAQLQAVRAREQPICLVPTMGALHDGHASLMQTASAPARGAKPFTVVSIFVNPLQFAPTEDLARYPRTLDEDMEICERQSVPLVFAPNAEQMYPYGLPEVRVHPGPLGDILEGQIRPGHFSGVLTVVAKLFAMVGPQLAVFGEKDYQQLALIKAMVRDLSLPLEVVGAPTVREPDGLALSSRNRYLSPDQRSLALAIARSLEAGSGAATGGAEAASAAARQSLEAAGLDPDYVAVRAPDLGEPSATGAARLLVAARVGTTRLIDNQAVLLGPGTVRPT